MFPFQSATCYLQKQYNLPQHEFNCVLHTLKHQHTNLSRRASWQACHFRVEENLAATTGLGGSGLQMVSFSNFERGGQVGTRQLHLKYRGDN